MACASIEDELPDLDNMDISEVFDEDITEADFASLASGSTDSEDEPPYCKCGKDNDLSMVGCDGKNCKHEWWHYTCAGLTQQDVNKLPSKWLCPDCRKGKKSSQKQVQHAVITHSGPSTSGIYLVNNTA